MNGELKPDLVEGGYAGALCAQVGEVYSAGFNDSLGFAWFVNYSRRDFF